MTSLGRFLVGSAAVVGAGVAGFVAFAAGANDSDPSGPSAKGVVDQVEDTPGTLVAPWVVTPPARFSADVSAVTKTDDIVDAFQAGDVTIRLRRDGSGEVCWTALLGDSEYGACTPDALLRTGLAYAEFGGHDRPAEVFGVVPDEVASVVVNGAPVGVVNNVWYVAAADDSTSIEFIVSSADGAVVARSSDASGTGESAD